VPALSSAVRLLVVTDAKVGERHVEHQSSTLRERHQVNSVGGLEGEKDAKTTRMGQKVVGGMKWLGARGSFGGGVLAEFFLMMPPIENVEHRDKRRKKNLTYLE
jgi:hypothetical protein